MFVRFALLCDVPSMQLLLSLRLFSPEINGLDLSKILLRNLWCFIVIQMVASALCQRKICVTVVWNFNLISLSPGVFFIKDLFASS